MAKASQVVILENEFYIIKAPNGKVLEVKDFNTENGAAIQLWSYAGHPWQQWHPQRSHPHPECAGGQIP